MLRKFLIFFLLFSAFNANSQNGNPDSDNDGVSDARDVDDDNDGIYDVDENIRETADLKSWVNRVNVGSNNSNNLIFNNGLEGWANGASSSYFDEYGFQKDYQVSFNVHISEKMAVGFGLNDLSQDLSDIENGFYFEGLTYRIINNGLIQDEIYEFKKNDEFIIAYNLDKINLYHENSLVETLSVLEDLSFAFDSSFYGEINGDGQGQIKDLTLSYTYADDDLDNDGLINSLDLDSDGDGCFDVVEAGFAEDDDDGILGTGSPTVDDRGKVISAQGYGCEDDETDCIELDMSFLNPNFNVCDINANGITIITKNMPRSEFVIRYNDNEPLQLISGEENSEIRLETIEGELNTIFIDVSATDVSSAINFKIEKNIDESITVFVDHQGEWIQFSPKFHRIIEDVVLFFNDVDIAKLPFILNLSDGVYYNRSNSLTLIIEKNIDLNGSMWNIQGPNNLSASIVPVDQIFTWDGTSAPSGNYRFSLSIQGKIFSGQFIIANE